MVDMHGNSPKTLRQELLKQRKEFAAGSSYPHVKESLISAIGEFLSNEGKLLRSIALYWPIQDELDIRTPLLSWAYGGGRRLALPYARPDKHLDFYEWRDGEYVAQVYVGSWPLPAAVWVGGPNGFGIQLPGNNQ